MYSLGIDEVGRGCWAGPLVAGAVCLGAPIPGLRDSKKLSKRQRERLAVIIHEEAYAVGLGWVWPGEVDELGLTAAVRLSMERAVSAAGRSYDEIIIDGNINYLDRLPYTRAIIKADDTVPAVSAASIVAKVARDAYMADAAAAYPGYGFERHVGYGTAEHIRALATLGVTEIHRKTYAPVKALLA